MDTGYFQEITELAKAKGIMPGSTLFQRIIANANDNLSRIKVRRDEHRWSKRGWVMGKDPSLRSHTQMTVAEYLLLKDRYMPEDADGNQRKKLSDELVRRHNHLRTYD